MKTYADCLPCFLRQALQVAKIVGCSPKQEQQAVLAVAEMLKNFDLEKSAPILAIDFYAVIAKVIGCSDPYLAIKKESNKQAEKILPKVREVVLQAEDRLIAAVRFAIAGNIIDYGASESFDIDGLISHCQTLPLIVDHSKHMRERFEKLKEDDKVLYLLDNCGEIVYDKVLLDYLSETGVELTLVTRGGAIINDATREDALSIGLDRYGKVITNGIVCPGSPVEICSDEFKDAFDNADLIISKGQGNFETLSESTRDILFLLTVKCFPAGKHMSELTGIDGDKLPGKGEMAIYYPYNN